MQSEMLYRRHLKKGDIFVHADLEGARPMIVKNRSKNPNAPIPPSTLSQAGNLCVATSSAWDSKAVMSAWWAQASQITKTAEVGGLLPLGDFSVKGEKNFLAPSQLVLGFGVTFQISKDSLKNHKTHFVDEPETAESTAEGGHEQAGESTQPPKQQETEEAPKPSEDPKEQAEEQSSDSDNEQDNADSRPARNPLQRGPSESPHTEPTQEGEKNTGSDGEDVAHKPEGQADALDEEEVDAPAEDESTPLGDESEHQLSATARQSPRKGKSPDSSEAGQQAPGKNLTAKVANAKQAPTPTRGKKGKAKKAAAKYADQDDEDRELALRLLGANKGKASKAAAAAEAKANREKEAEAQRKRRQAQHERAAEAERRRQALIEEGGDDYDEETAAAEAADLEWIPALIGMPRPEDEILAAIPVCAPWSALSRYRYKVKLQPGAVKKGKAVKEILGRWVAETTTGKVKKEYAEEAGISLADAEKLRAREGDVIKAWKETEIINSVPVGKVRIMLGAGGGGGGDGKGKGKGGGSGNKGGKGGKKK